MDKALKPGFADPCCLHFARAVLDSVFVMYDTANQLLSSTNPNLGFTYDAAGNMTKGYTPQGYEFTAAYDAENRLKSVQYTDGGTSVVHRVEYVYGASGFVGIIKKYENSVLIKETRMVRDGFLELQERDQNNAITREYVWGMNMGGGIGGLLSMRQQGQNYHYLYDGKGNVTAVLDTAQQIVASYRYDTFGRLMAKSGTLDQPFQFSTKRYDPDTGLNYYGYRFYSAVVGRWINRDPLEEEGGSNLYEFVGNNPLGWIDPDGLMKLPKDPSGLGPEWKPDDKFDPDGKGTSKQWRDSSGRPLRWDPAKPGKPGRQGKDHWHDPENDGNHKPRLPGEEIPDPAPLPCIQLDPKPPYLPYPSMTPTPKLAPLPPKEPAVPKKPWWNPCGCP